MFQIKTLKGNPMRLDGGAMFGNAPKALWSRWLEADDLNRIDIDANCLLIRTGQAVILFETGPGAYLSPKMKERFGVVSNDHVLLESLAAEGIGPEDVTHVVLSHLHFDHAGGLLTAHEDGKEPELVFSSARYITGRENFERSRAPKLRDRASFIPGLADMLAVTEKLDLMGHGDGLDIDGVKIEFVESLGHTPGMLVSKIQAGEAHLIFTGDLVPGHPWVNLPITMGYDRFPEALVEEKAVLLDQAFRDDAWLVFPHDGVCAAARLELDEVKTRFVPRDLTACLALTA